jgi:hypothetical protein
MHVVLLNNRSPHSKCKTTQAKLYVHSRIYKAKCRKISMHQLCKEEPVPVHLAPAGNGPVEKNPSAAAPFLPLHCYDCRYRPPAKTRAVSAAAELPFPACFGGERGAFLFGSGVPMSAMVLTAVGWVAPARRRGCLATGGAVPDICLLLGITYYYHLCFLLSIMFSV